MWTITLC